MLDVQLVCATFLKVDVGTDNQLRLKDPLKHSWNVLTKLCFKLIAFLQKIIHSRRLTGS